MNPTEAMEDHRSNLNYISIYVSEPWIIASECQVFIRVNPSGMSQNTYRQVEWTIDRWQASESISYDRKFLLLYSNRLWTVKLDAMYVNM
jgi:hypothetical protein